MHSERMASSRMRTTRLRTQTRVQLVWEEEEEFRALATSPSENLSNKEQNMSKDVHDWLEKTMILLYDWTAQ
jgi:hypothetical protein